MAEQFGDIPDNPEQWGFSDEPTVGGSADDNIEDTLHLVSPYHPGEDGVDDFTTDEDTEPPLDPHNQALLAMLTDYNAAHLSGGLPVSGTLPDGTRIDKPFMPEAEVAELAAQNAEDGTDLTREEHVAMRFEKVRWDHNTTLEESGLFFGDNMGAAQLLIHDGPRFAATLAAVPQDHNVLMYGMMDAIGDSLFALQRAYVPFHGDERNDSFFIHPTRLEETIGDDTITTTITHTLLVAEEIAATLDTWYPGHEDAAELRRLHHAELVNLLPECVVASYWGIFQQPDDEVDTMPWTSWQTPDKWLGVQNFVTHAVDRNTNNPEGIAFLRNMITTFADNIQLRIQSEMGAVGDSTTQTNADPDFISDYKNMLSMHGSWLRAYAATLA